MITIPILHYGLVKENYSQKNRLEREAKIHGD